LHGGRRNADVRLYAFDLLAHDGVDMRDQPLQIRKLRLGKLLKRSGDGILLNEYEAGEIGPRLFELACKMGLEGIVSKHREKTYRAGRCAFWIKVKNPKSPAMLRAKRAVGEAAPPHLHTRLF
jgi:bifunctional non-homologous end joining protein LigD